MKVYRFEKNTEKRLQTILSDEIHLSSPEGFNDLEDCFLEGIFTPSDDQHYQKLKNCVDILYPEEQQNYSPFPKEALSELKRFFTSFEVQESPIKSRFDRESIVRKIQDILRKRTGVCCFFKDAPSHPLMWAHYADSHKGFCIEYEVDKENPLFPINYSSEPLEPSIYELLLCPSETLSRILTTKSIEWQYEKEVRLISLNTFENGEKGKNISLPTAMRPTKIIIGAKFNYDDNKHLVEKIKEKLNIDVVPYKKFIYQLKQIEDM